MICRDRTRDLLVNVSSFRPIGSEERMTFGSGGAVETIVADFRGDADRGGVTGTGPVPPNLTSLLSGPVSINYGNQTFTAETAPEERTVEQFVASCTQALDVKAAPAEPVSACRIQNGQKLNVAAYRALGTEPFWNARIEGRCVTYSQPENIPGSRVWTQFERMAGDGGRWTGALDDRRFQLTIVPKNGCSDGMSDRSYPYEAELLVGSERRRGCAEIR